MEHWLSPLFNGRRWGVWRQERLGLPAVPYAAQAETTGEPLPPPPPLLLAVSELVVPRPGYWPASVEPIGFLSGAACGVSDQTQAFREWHSNLGD